MLSTSRKTEADRRPPLVVVELNKIWRGGYAWAIYDRHSAALIRRSDERYPRIYSAWVAGRRMVDRLKRLSEAA